VLFINNCPTRCNIKQSIYYSASSLYMFPVSATPIIRSIQNCNYIHRYWSYFLCNYLPPTWPSYTKLWLQPPVLVIFCVQLPPSNVAKLHKTVTTASGTDHIFCTATSLQRGQATQNCDYSLRYWSYFVCSYLPPTWPSYTKL